MKHSLVILFYFICVTPKLQGFASGWEETGYIWNFNLRNICNVGVDVPPEKYFETSEYQYESRLYENIKKNDLVWLRPSFIKEFYQNILPKLDQDIILVVNDGDESFPKNCRLNPTEVEYLLNHPNILHVFCQNLDYQGPSKKIAPIPIGIDFHSVGYKGGYWGEKGSPKSQERILNHVFDSSPPTSMRKKRIFVDFHHSESMRASFSRYLEFKEDRRSIFREIVKTGLVDHTKKLSRNKLWRIKGQYAFSVSPWGNGLDCHRTWEDLVLGCIVIVKKSALDPLYEGLPVVIVQDWREITKENLDKWFDLYRDASENPEYRKRLTNAFWIDKILRPLKK